MINYQKCKKDISKKEFTEKYEKIYSGIEVKDLKGRNREVKEDKKMKVLFLLK